MSGKKRLGFIDYIQDIEIAYVMDRIKRNTCNLIQVHNLLITIRKLHAREQI